MYMLAVRPLASNCARLSQYLCSMSSTHEMNYKLEYKEKCIQR